MNSIKGIALLVIGWIFIALGIVGLFLPFLQGIVFIVIGLVILSPRSKAIRRLMKRLEERYPQHHRKIETWRKKVSKWFKKD